MKMQISNFIASKALTFVGAIAVASSAHAAVIAYQDFDAPANAWAYTNVGGNVSSAAGATDSPANSRAISGTSLRASADVDGTEKLSTLTFDAVSVADYDSVQIEIPLAAVSKTSGNGLDGPDYVRVFVALDNAAFSASHDLRLNGNANARWAFSATGTASTTAGTAVTVQGPVGLGGGNGASPNGIAKLLIDIPDSASFVALKLVFSVDNTGEIWATDNISLNGTAAIPEPASFGLIAAAGSMLLGRRRRHA